MDAFLPQRPSLVGECARALRARLNAGEWPDGLPGERKMAALLGVGRDTIRLALRQLQDEGAISPAVHGVRRLVAGTKRRRRRKTEERVGILVPLRLELMPQPILLEIDQIRESLGAGGRALHVHSPAWYASRAPLEKMVKGLLETERCAAWLLYRSSAWVQQAFQDLGAECLIRGYPHEGITLPHLDIDWRATARHAAGVLWRLGHRRVAVLVPPDVLRGVKAALDGLSEFAEEGFRVLEVHEDGTARGLAKSLQDITKSADAPTALVAIRPRQAATSLSALAHRGIRVPDDISLISLAHEPFLDHLLPEITRYHVDPAVTARLVLRKLETIISGRSHPGGNPWITPDFQAGESTARPPARE